MSNAYKGWSHCFANFILCNTSLANDQYMFAWQSNLSHPPIRFVLGKKNFY